MAEQNQCAVDVLPAADANPAGDSSVGSVGTQDLQYTRLVIDIGDSKTIEITLRGKLTLQSIGPKASSGEGSGATAAQQPGLTGEHRSVTSVEAVEDREYLQQMRGWLMTVATLFIGITFQAAMQPPSWITPDWFEVNRRRHRHSSGLAAPSPSPAAAATPATTTMTSAQASKAAMYVFSNTATFALSVASVMLLLLMKKSPHPSTMTLVTSMVASLCVTVGMTFLSGNSYGPQTTRLVTVILVCYGLGTFLWIAFMSRFRRFILSRRSRGRRAN